MHLTNLLEKRVGLEIRAPKAAIRGGCDQDFRKRFCAEEYEVVGVIDLGPLEDRVLAISDDVSEVQCTNVLWFRLVRLDEVGPVDDPGTLIQLPADAEIELGAGVIHSVAFPEGTVRIDEIGGLDANQGPPPLSCAILGREPRG